MKSGLMLKVREEYTDNYPWIQFCWLYKTNITICSMNSLQFLHFSSLPHLLAHLSGFSHRGCVSEMQF